MEEMIIFFIIIHLIGWSKEGFAALHIQAVRSIYIKLLCQTNSKNKQHQCYEPELNEYNRYNQMT